MSKLMLGGGVQTPNYQRVGWSVLDGSPDYDAEFVATIPPLPPEVTAQKWDLVCAVHFIEHLFLADAKVLIEEIYGILPAGGFLILEQANLERVMRFVLGDIRPPVEKYEWMKGDDAWFGMRSLYPQPDQMSGNSLNSHKYGYTPETLTDLVESCGFQREKIDIRVALRHVSDRDFKLSARK